MVRYKVYSCSTDGRRLAAHCIGRCKDIRAAYAILERERIEPIPGIVQSVAVWSIHDKEIVARKSG